MKVKDPPEPTFDQPAEDDVETAGEMYFTKPEQLLQVGHWAQRLPHYPL